MSLDEQLRAALSHQADVQDAPRPDVNRLIRGGRVRRRRRNLMRAGGAALAVVLISGGVYGVTQVDRKGDGPSRIIDEPPSTSESPSTTPPDLPNDGNPALEPGITYRMLVGFGATGAIHADLTFEGQYWFGADQPLLHEASAYGGVGVYRPRALAAGSGCVGEDANTDVGETRRALARQLARLPGSMLAQPITPVQAFGHEALHLQLQFADVLACPDGEYYRVAETYRGDRGISFDAPSKMVVMDFWVVDVDGTAVVVDSWLQTSTSVRLDDDITSVLDSIVFVTDE